MRKPAALSGDPRANLAGSSEYPNRLLAASLAQSGSITVPPELDMITILKEVKAPEVSNINRDLIDLQIFVCDLPDLKEIRRIRPTDASKSVSELLRVIPKILQTIEEDYETFDLVTERLPNGRARLMPLITAERDSLKNLLVALRVFKERPLYDLDKGPKPWHGYAVQIWGKYLAMFWKGPDTLKTPGYKLIQEVLSRTKKGHFSIDAIKKALERYGH